MKKIESTIKTIVMLFAMIFTFASCSSSDDNTVIIDDDGNVQTIDMTDYVLLFTIELQPINGRTPISPFAYDFTENGDLLFFGNEEFGNYDLNGTELRVNTSLGSIWFDINPSTMELTYVDATSTIKIDKYQLVKKSQANAFENALANKTFSGMMSNTNSDAMSTINFKFSDNKFIHYAAVVGGPPEPSYTIFEKTNNAFRGTDGNITGYRGVIISGKLYVWWGTFGVGFQEWAVLQIN